MGNDGQDGVQTGGSPADSLGVMAVASVDNMYTLKFFIIAPDGHKIFYLPGAAFGGWQAIVNSTIVVNGQLVLRSRYLITFKYLASNSTTSDGCFGLAKSVLGAVVLFAYSSADSCGSAVRCDKAALAGATGCLLYNVGAIRGFVSFLFFSFQVKMVFQAHQLFRVEASV